MIDFFGVPFLIAVGISASYYYISRYFIYKKVEWDLAIFREALYRKHDYVCEGGHTDKTLHDFLVEVEEEMILAKKKERGKA